MKALLDSNIIVASIWQGHPHHAASKAWLTDPPAKAELAKSQHGLLEAYAVLTALPVRPRHTPALVNLAMREVLSAVEVLPLHPKDYWVALKEAEARDCRGGTVYDLLHLQAAVSWGATKLVTLNSKHFRRLVSPGSVEIVEP